MSRDRVRPAMGESWHPPAATPGPAGRAERPAWFGLVALRDSKNPGGGVLLFTAHEWRVFLAGVRDGEFDDS